MHRIYIADISSVSDNADTLCLSEYRRRKLDAMHLLQKRKQGIGAELLLNRAVRDVDATFPLPLDINAGSIGKPSAKNLPFFFNLAHSGKYALCAIADSELGVDIEYLPKLRPAVVKRCFTEWEQDYIAAAKNKDRAFARIWTAKESALKCIGAGISIPFTDVCIINKSSVKVKSYGSLNTYFTDLEDAIICVCSFAELNEPEIIRIEL